MTRMPFLITGLAVWASAAPPASAAIIGFENNLLHVGGTATASPAGISIRNGRIDAVGIIGLSRYDITGLCGGVGCLDLDTGAFLGVVAGNPNAYRYAGGGLINVTGTVDTPMALDPTGLLFSGAFDLLQEVIVQLDVDGAGNPLDTATLQGTLGPGVLSVELATFLGLPTLTATGALNSFVTSIRIAFPAGGAPTGTGTVGRTDIQIDTEGPEDNPTVPEPGSVVLLGTGLVAAGAAVRKRLRARR